MIAVGVFIVLLVLIGGYLLVRTKQHSIHDPELATRRRLLAADQQVASEADKTRRAMRTASGQSWRDLAG